MWDLSSPTGDQTRAACSGSREVLSKSIFISSSLKNDFASYVVADFFFQHLKNGYHFFLAFIASDETSTLIQISVLL